MEDQGEGDTSLASKKIPKIPVGFRFKPDPVDVVERYLLPRILKGIRAPAYLIRECDVYQHDPWDLFQLQRPSFKYSDDNMYFFSPRHHAGGSSSTHRTCRIAGSGFWGHGKDETIKKGKQVIGHKRQLTFKKVEGKKKTIKTDWLMHEFRLADEGKFDVVLCRIYQKKGVARRQEDHVHSMLAPQMTSTTMLSTLEDHDQDLPVAPLLPGSSSSLLAVADHEKPPAAELDDQDEFEWTPQYLDSLL